MGKLMGGGWWRRGRPWALVFAWLCLLGNWALAAPAPVEIRVLVSVSSEPPGTKELAGMFLSRELRKIPEVIVTDTDPYYELCVVVFPCRFSGESPTGYAAGFSLRNRHSREATARFLSQRLSAENFSTYQRLSAKHHALIYEAVLTHNDIESICKTIVQRIDASEFENLRQAAQLIKDLPRQQQAAAKAQADPCRPKE